MWTASAEQQLFSRMAESALTAGSAGTGMYSTPDVLSAKGRRISARANTSLQCSWDCSEHLSMSWGRTGHLLFKMDFSSRNRAQPFFHSLHHQQWAQHCQTVPALSPFHLSSRQTLLQSVTRTSLQCHSTPTVIPEPALALNLVQIFKVAITSYTSLLPRGDKLQIYTIPYQYFLKVIYCFASNSYCFFDCRRADFSDDHCNGVCAAPSFPTH